MRCLFFVALIVFGCGSSTKASDQAPFELKGVAMTIPYRILVGEPLSVADQQQISLQLDGLFLLINDHFNKWNPDSEISQLNRAVANEPVELSKPLFTLLEQTDRLVHFTEGRFDPAVETLNALWRDRVDRGELPDSEQLKSLSLAAHWKQLQLVNQSLIKNFSATQIDLGGIAKGYMIDLFAERLNSLGISNFLIEWGGELRASGVHPEGRAWQVGITNPETPQNELKVIELTNQSIATSGSYYQTWMLDDQRVTHIWDPSVGLPLSVDALPFVSVTVLAPTCTEADAIATALMLFKNEKEAILWIQEHLDEKQFQVWLIASKEKSDES
jgi:Membrane-associated lipoprotein involved in thiamine biosynthesis